MTTAVLAVMLAVAPPALATVKSVSVNPPSPATCDSVMLVALGETPNSCERLVSAEVIGGPEPIPEWVGPLPAYRTRIVLTVEVSATEQPCLLVVSPYRREFFMGHLPLGQHLVTAVEHVVEPGGAVRESSLVSTSFDVRVDSCTVAPCVLLQFVPPAPGPTANLACSGSGRPGGEGCFDLALANTVPVGGAQFRIRITDEQGGRVPDGWFIPKSAATTTRTEPMQVAWQGDGDAIDLLLFSATNAVIPAGRGPILRVCYSIGPEAKPGVYRIGFEKILVADPEGHELGLCPTFREETGRFCVASGEGCDLNGDGIADIRDIIHLVRCALAGDACPDSIAMRADCNADGAIDIRDVICCVRKLLALPQPQEPGAPPGSEPPTRIGFAGPATWVTPLQGRAIVTVDPGAAFGGLEFGITPSAGLRVTELRLTDGAGSRLEWTRSSDGSARGLLLRTGDAPAAAASLSVTVEPTGGSVDAGTLRLLGVRGATWDGALATTNVTADTSPVAPAPIATPTISAARPNPFGETTEIPFALPSRARASLRVYDVGGHLVRTLFDGVRPAGVERVTWDGRNTRGSRVPAGIYFVKLSASGADRTARILKMK